MAGPFHVEIEPRPLTNDERILIHWLLTRGVEMSSTTTYLGAAFLPQIDALRVVSHCSCGCPTIDLALDDPNLAVQNVTGTVADVEGRSPEGTEIGVILRANNGVLKELELYARDNRLPFSLPGPTQLESFW
jgi:hypothetical protein